MRSPFLSVNNFIITTRPATTNDLVFLDRIYTQNMQCYVELNYIWNPDLFKSKFIPNDYTVLIKEKKIIGFFKLTPEENNLYLGEIQIKKNFQNQGIGTKLIKEIIQQNKSKYQTISLQVLKGNPAIKFYQRLGFIISIATKTHYKMQLSLQDK
jgi:ribosomal protein S18 acetylase RimI-like enzyme